MVGSRDRDRDRETPLVARAPRLRRVYPLPTGAVPEPARDNCLVDQRSLYSPRSRPSVEYWRGTAATGAATARSHFQFFFKMKTIAILFIFNKYFLIINYKLTRFKKNYLVNYR